MKFSLNPSESEIKEIILSAKSLNIVPVSKFDGRDYILNLKDEDVNMITEDFLYMFDKYKKLKKSFASLSDYTVEIDKELNQKINYLNDLNIQANYEVQKELENGLEHVCWEHFSNDIKRTQQEISYLSKINNENKKDYKKQKEILIELNLKCQILSIIKIEHDKIKGKKHIV